MEDKEKIELIEKALKKINGVNVMIKNDKGKILVGRSTYGEKLFMLPGGAVERGELPKHAAASETEEETGIIIEERDLILIGYVTQRLKGLQSAQGTVFIYECTKYSEQQLMSFTPELIDISFMSFEEIYERKNEFGLGYLRMIIAYHRVIEKYEPVIPFERRLSDSIEIFFNGHLIQA
jgi:8-oxo-dGTP pyrophosphatase MutT (NUDIX family)